MKSFQIRTNSNISQLNSISFFELVLLLLNLKLYQETGNGAVVNENNAAFEIAQISVSWETLFDFLTNLRDFCFPLKFYVIFQTVSLFNYKLTIGDPWKNFTMTNTTQNNE